MRPRRRCRARPGSRRAARAGGGAGARQRRPRPARRLLHGLAGDARDPRHRLRHPLRVRHLRPGDPRRLAGRDDRQVAAPRQPLGDPRPGDRLRGAARRPHRASAATSAAATACAGCPSASCRASPTTRRSSATARHRQHAAAVEGRGRPSRSTSRPSTPATTTAPSTRRSSSENLTKVLYPNDEPLRGKRLRLEQQYFFVSCSLQDMIRIHLQRGRPLRARREVRGPAQRHPSRRSPSPS